MTKFLIPALLFLATIAAFGCTHAEEGDTSPLPPVDAQTRLEKSTKAIEQSNMTPEQKQAALNYVRQNADTAAKMKQSADQARSGSK